MPCRGDCRLDDPVRREYDIFAAAQFPNFDSIEGIGRSMWDTAGDGSAQKKHLSRSLSPRPGDSAAAIRRRTARMYHSPLLSRQERNICCNTRIL
jgi:hypothetical protein